MGSGNYSGGLGIIFPCREEPFSQDSVALYAWGSSPNLERARWFVVSLEGIFVLVGLVWNAFILACYCRTPKLLGEPANMYLFNLAAIDIFFTVFVTLTSLISEAAGEFLFGASDFSRCVYCKFLGAVFHILISLSLHTLAALSVDRCMLLAHPIRYENLFNWKKALVILLFVWAVSITISVPPLFGFGDYEYNLVFSFCNARWTGESRGIPNIYYILSFGLEAMIPILVLVIMNIWIIVIVKGAMKERIVRQRSFRGSKSLAHSEEMAYQNQQKQLIKVFGALFVAHVVCWVPVFTVMFVALAIGAGSIPQEVFVAGWLAFLTSPAVHPILETFFVKDLRYRVNTTRKTVNTSLKKAHSNLQHQLSSSSLLKGLNSKHFSSASLNIPSPTITTNGTMRRVNSVLSHGLVVESRCSNNSQSGKPVSPIGCSRPPLQSRRSNVSFKLSNSDSTQNTNSSLAVSKRVLPKESVETEHNISDIIKVSDLEAQTAEE